MRSLEIVLSLALVLTFCLVARPRRRSLPWMGYVPLITVLIAGLQILVEGSRWEMFPAYALAILFFVVWVLGLFTPGGLHVHRVIAGFAIGLGLLVLALCIALPVVLPVFHFPTPTGPYQIGTVTYHWVETRHEIFSPDPQAQRQLMAQVWSPVTGDTSSVRVPYVQDASALSSGFARSAHLPGFILDHLQYVTTNAIPSAPMATIRPVYPVLIFLSGLTGFRQSNTFQVEELVAHGYIVVGLDQPYAAAAVTFPDGQQIIGWTRDQMQPLINQSLSPVQKAPMVHDHVLTQGIIPYFAQDVSFTLDQLTALNTADPSGLLTERLDLHHVGTFGISLGAIVAAEACHADRRLTACLMMDAAMPIDVVQAGLRQPSMWLTRDAATMRRDNWSAGDIVQALTTMRAVYHEEPAGDGYFVVVPGMFHVNFTDAPSYTPLARQLGLSGPINARRGFGIVNAYSLAFFNQYVKGSPAALLDDPAKQYSDVRFERRAPP